MNAASSIHRRCIEFLRTRQLLRPGMHYLLAVSGGMDSMVLLRVAGDLASSWDLSLTAAYIDHGLRPEAKEEAECVASAAAAAGAAFVSRRVDPKGMQRDSGGSIQDIARRLRYDALEEIRDEVGADLILTAHHADDQAETILLHVLKGAGVHGCSGIRPVLGRIARPLLGVSRRDIEEFVAENGIEWRHDVSNDSDAYLRNALRHHVIPAIRQHINPGLSATMGRTAELFAGMETFLDDWVARVAPAVIRRSENAVSLAVQGLKEYFEFQQYTLIREGIQLSRSRPASFEETIAVQQLLDKAPGTHVTLRHGIIAWRERDVIRLGVAETRAADLVVVVPGETVRLGAFEFSSCAVPAAEVAFEQDASTEFIDADAIRGDMILRWWRDGDRLIPLGFHHTKNVSDLLTDQHIPNHRRREVPVLECLGSIVWVCGVRLDDRFKVTPDTRTAWRLTYRKTEEDA